jgi:hypothetical protein
MPVPIPKQNTQGIERVIRSDSGVAHRLSLSARVLSAADSQVKAKRQGWKRLWGLKNRARPEACRARHQHVRAGFESHRFLILSGYYTMGRCRSARPRLRRSSICLSRRNDGCVTGPVFALNSRRHRHRRRRRRRCRRRPDRPLDAGYGSDRPRAFDRRRPRRAAWRASRVRSPCRRISR